MKIKERNKLVKKHHFKRLHIQIKDGIIDRQFDSPYYSEDSPVSIVAALGCLIDDIRKLYL